MRQIVNCSLRQRPCLSPEEWVEALCLLYTDLDRPVAQFAFTHLKDYSGLEFGRVLPGDRLTEDLHWVDVCWFDWQLHLCEDFWQQFGVDISDCFDLTNLSTVADLIMALNHQQIGQQMTNDAER